MRKFKCIIITERFPNIYHSYILNQMEYIIKKGGDISIISGPPLGEKVDDRIYKYGLLRKNYSFCFNSFQDMLRGLSVFNPIKRESMYAIKGLWKNLKVGALDGYDYRKKIKGVLKSAILTKEKECSLIHSHYLMGAYENLFISKALNAPLIVSFHGLQTNNLKYPFGLKGKETETVFRNAKAFTAGTKYAKRILTDFGCPEEKIHVLPVGLYLDNYSYFPKGHSKKRTAIILTVARLSPEKGHKYAIEAVAEVIRRGWKVEYRLVGGGPYRKDLERKIREMQASDFISIVGEKSGEDLKREYEKAHIFVLPSIREDNAKYAGETQGLVIQEAQASGKIVVATDAGGIPECIKDGTSAFLVPEKNALAIADKIDWVLGNSNKWKEWQEAGRKWVEEKYSMDVLGNKLFEIYKTAMS